MTNTMHSIFQRKNGIFYLNNDLFNCIRNSLIAQTYNASDFSQRI